MADGSENRGLRERLTGSAEERLGRALSDLLENPLLTGVLGHAFDARERAAQAQELAMNALNLPSATDIERLTRRLRSVSQRLEGLEDGVHRLDRSLSTPRVESRLQVIEEQLRTLNKLVGDVREGLPGPALSVSRDQERLPVQESETASGPSKPKRQTPKRSATRSRPKSKS
ncbi:MAG TPA: hypothetical protein VGF15_05920 [Solirubrobacteraceae bacterium]|jgi:hypothetical protein